VDCGTVEGQVAFCGVAPTDVYNVDIRSYSDFKLEIARKINKTIQYFVQ
jgi:hypothetical protein